MCLNILSSLAWPSLQNFSSLSHKRYDLKKNSFAHKIHGLSGKFPNVQNSPPLCRPSGARQVLLSSIEFDELRRENCTPLSCLVIVLCFFMWSHVWRIWRFSRDKKMSVFHNQRICVKFCVKIGKICIFWFALRLSEIYPVLWRIRGDIIKNVHKFSCKVSIGFVRF